jgi:hypothetical protein
LEELAAADTARLELRKDLAYARRLSGAVELRAGRLETARDFAAAAGALLPHSAPVGTPRMMLTHGASARLLEGIALARLGDSDGASTRWKDAERLVAPLHAAADDPVALSIAIESRMRLNHRAEAEQLLARFRKTGYRESGFVGRMSELGMQY